MGPTFLITIAILSMSPNSSCKIALELDAGDTIPCSNSVLLPYDMAESLLLCRDIKLPRCEAKLERELLVNATKYDSCMREHALCDDALNKMDLLLEKAIENQAEPKWYHDPWMNIAVGVAIGSALTASVM